MCSKDTYKQIINLYDSGDDWGSEKEKVPEGQQNQTGEIKLEDGMLMLI